MGEDSKPKPLQLRAPFQQKITLWGADLAKNQTMTNPWPNFPAW